MSPVKSVTPFYNITQQALHKVTLEIYVGENFAVFADFQQTAKVFPTNFINLYKAKYA